MTTYPMEPYDRDLEARHQAWLNHAHGKIVFTEWGRDWVALRFDKNRPYGSTRIPEDHDSALKWCAEHGIRTVTSPKVEWFYLDPDDEDQEFLIRMRWL